MIGVVSCSSPQLGAIVSAFRKILNLIQIIVPILLMIGMMIHITNLIKKPDDEKLKKKIIHSIIAAILVFFIPMFINAVMLLVGENTSISACWNQASNPGESTTYVQVEEERERSGFITDSSEYEKGKKRVVSTTGGSSSSVHGNMKYYVYVPSNAPANLPLLVWLHGDGAGESGPKSQTLGKTAASAGYPAIVVQPYSPNMGSSGNPGWFEGGHLGEVKAIVDEVCAKYQCDKTNINVGGHSRGAIGAWMMASTYGSFFHSVAPISCCSGRGFKAQNFKGLKVWAMRGSGAGSGYSSDDTYGHCMQSSVNSVKKYAREVRYTILPRTTHGGAGSNAVSNQEMVKFIFSK